MAAAKYFMSMHFSAAANCSMFHLIDWAETSFEKGRKVVVVSRVQTMFNEKHMFPRENLVRFASLQRVAEQQES